MKDCGYDTAEEMVQDRIVFGIKSDNLRSTKVVHGLSRAARANCMKINVPVMVDEPANSSQPGGIVVSPSYQSLEP